MAPLSPTEIELVTGGFKLNIGQAIGAMVFGFVTGGPVGLGYAVSVVIIAQGVNSLDELARSNNQIDFQPYITAGIRPAMF